MTNIELSIKWYQEVLRLKKYQLSEWGSFPVFMLAGKSGVALFPAIKSDKDLDAIPHKKCVDHFAFNVTNENFEIAKRKYQRLDLEFNIQDHHYFHSIYTKDPDGHTVELTTLVVDENTFYQ